MFVISNRMHSLLIGTAFGAYPICLYQESAATIKIKHVFKSSFSSNLPIIYSDGELPVILFDELYNQNIEQIGEEFKKNSELCRSTIESIMFRFLRS